MSVIAVTKLEAFNPRHMAGRGRNGPSELWPVCFAPRGGTRVLQMKTGGSIATWGALSLWLQRI